MTTASRTRSSPPDDDTLDDELAPVAMALEGRRIVVLTGAGVSTESGIPDYRGEGTRQRARNPVRFATFTSDASARRRYWARAFLGWPKIRDAQPNVAHTSLAAWERMGRISGVITQNVDGLHGKAGSVRVTELHGALKDTLCLACGAHEARESVQGRLARANPTFTSDANGRAAHAPDGDVDLDDAFIERFVVVDCVHCAGALKPRVVFFGENVPLPVLDDARRTFDDAAALVVLGSSLEVYSGRRFVDEAVKRRWPIVIINRGPTRADVHATVRVDASVGAALARLVVVDHT
jgi:NAD-dependent deacetylase sirtuin 4